MLPMGDEEHRALDGTQDNSAHLVAARLRRSGYPFLRSVKCEFRGGVTVLSGTDSTFPLKQLAKVLVSQTPGARQIKNRVQVISSGVRDLHDLAG